MVENKADAGAVGDAGGAACGHIGGPNDRQGLHTNVCVATQGGVADIPAAVVAGREGSGIGGGDCTNSQVNRSQEEV